MTLSRVRVRVRVRVRMRVRVRVRVRAKMRLRRPHRWAGQAGGHPYVAHSLAQVHDRQLRRGRSLPPPAAGRGVALAHRAIDVQRLTAGRRRLPEARLRL